MLSLFFARGAGQAGTTLRILAGQYLSFAGILAATILVTLGADAFLPTEAIPYFGLIPLALGLWAAWQAWQGDDDDDAKVSGKNVSALIVAGVTFANGGDNIGVYVPVFLNVDTATVIIYCVVFLLLVAGLVLLAKFVATPSTDRGGSRTMGACAVPDRFDWPGYLHPRQRRRLRPLISSSPVPPLDWMMETICGISPA
ncbi:Cadmium resistance transporter [Corynebacterium urogenitale]|uniref:Cadmium resistance transporter n=1 Tax=Corynebacterium urogenitale TaxID=2487892 RepID=A0A5J6Z825_9CORY|nr:Cadmium resistance transporter [Corynebacterium urogenitale]